jgi:hypothetical protein
MGHSLISPVFLQNAEDLLRRLDAVPGPEARALGAEARELAELFRAWLSRGADDAERSAAIGRFLDLYRRACEFLAHHQPPSSGKGGPTSSGRDGPVSSNRGLPRVNDDEDDD